MRLWLRGDEGLRRIADRVGADRKTVRRYIEAAVAAGLVREAGEASFLTSWGLRLTTVHELLERRGVVVPYRTLHRFAVEEFGLGRAQLTVRVADCEPGAELQVGFGRLGMVLDGGRRRALWAGAPPARTSLGSSGRCATFVKASSPAVMTERNEDQPRAPVSSSLRDGAGLLGG